MTNELEKLFESHWKNGFRTCGNQVGGRETDTLKKEREEIQSQITQAIQRECLSGVMKLGECSCQNGNQYFGDGEDGMPVWGACDVCVVEGQYTPKTITIDDIKNFAKSKDITI